MRAVKQARTFRLSQLYRRRVDNAFTAAVINGCRFKIIFLIIFRKSQNIIRPCGNQMELDIFKIVPVRNIVTIKIYFAIISGIQTKLTCAFKMIICVA